MVTKTGETQQITTPLLKGILAMGHWAMRVNSGRVPTKGGWMHGAPEGTPDIFALIRGRAVFIETKTPVGKLSAVQTKAHDVLRRSGAHVLTVHGVREGLDEVGRIGSR